MHACMQRRPLNVIASIDTIDRCNVDELQGLTRPKKATFRKSDAQKRINPIFN